MTTSNAHSTLPMDATIPSSLISPQRQKFLQCIVLLLCGMLAIGSNYCFHTPAALKNQLQQHFSNVMNKSEYEILFNMLYTVYSTPNIILPFVGGYLVDRFGAQHMMFILTSLVLIGQSMMAFGCTISSFHLMLIGRIVFGFGGESLGVARTTFIATWFKKRDLALALGISGSFSGFASILNNMLSPYFADRFGVSFSLWFSALVCALSVASTAILMPIDASTRALTPHLLPNGQPQLMKTNSSIQISDVKHFGTVFWLIVTASVAVWGSIIPFQTVAGSILLERDFFRRPPPECRRCGEGNYASYTDCQEIVPSCPPFPPYAWPLPKLSANCTMQRSIDQSSCFTDPPYIADSEINCDNLIWKQGSLTASYCTHKIAAEEKASRVMSLPSFISLIASPLFGYTVGKIKNRGLIALTATAFIVISQFFIATTHLSIWWLLFIQGTSSCLYFSVVWPSIPYVVEEHHVGSAYGTIIAIGNLMLAILPMVVAEVFRIYGQYLPMVELVLTIVSCISFVSCCALYFMEQRHGRLLNPNTPHIQRARRLSQTGALWGGTTSPNHKEREHLLRSTELHHSAGYESIPSIHEEKFKTKKET